MADETPDMLAQIRALNPSLASYDDATLAKTIADQHPDYRPYLRKYLTSYPVEAPATAASAAQDVTAADEKTVEDRFPDYGPFGVAKKGAELLGTPEMKAAIADMEGPNSRAAANLATGAAQWGLEQFTPGNVAVVAALGPVGKALPWLGRTAAGGFSAMMAWDAIKSIPGLYDLYQQGLKTGDMDEFQRQATKAGLSGAAAVLAGGHALKGPSLEAKLAKSEADLQKSKIALERASQEGDLASKQETHKNIKDAFGEGHEATETARRAVEQQQEVIDALNAATAPQPAPLSIENASPDFQKMYRMRWADWTDKTSAEQQRLLVQDRAAHGGPPPGHTRLWRGEAEPGKESSVPDWLQQDPDFVAVKDASGRWFTNDPEKANWYKEDAGPGGRRVYVDVPTESLDSYRASKNPAASRLSLDPENEFLIPRELADRPVVDEMRPRDLPETVGAAPPIVPGAKAPPSAPLSTEPIAEMTPEQIAAAEVGPDTPSVRARAAGVVEGANGEKVIPNQPPSPDAEAGLTTELSMRGVDVNNDQAAMDYFTDDLSKPAKVTSVGDVPVSASYAGEKNYSTDLADAALSKKAHESDHMASEEGKRPPPPEGPGANDQVVADTLTRKTGDPVGAFNRQTYNVNRDLTTLASNLENSVFHKDILADQTERIAEQGTIAPESRRQFQKGDDVDTKQLRVSQADQEQLISDFIQTSRKAKKLAAEVIGRGDGVSRAAADVLWKQSKLAEQQLDQIVKEIRVIRKAQGRMVDAWQRHPEIMDSIRAMANDAERLRDAGLRAPILTNILRGLKDIGHLTPAEKWQLSRDVVDLLRYSKFSVTSFTMDVATNGWNLGAMVAEGIGKDIGRAVTGRLDFSNLRGWGRAADDRFWPYFDKKKPGMWKFRINRGSPEIKEGLGHTISGEDIRGAGIKGAGAFTYREGIPITLKPNAEGVYVEPPGARFIHNASKALSIVVDNAVGGPMYMKGLVDKAAGELGAGASLWVDAIQNTPKELRGAGAYQWRRNFVDNPPPEFAEKALEIGNKAKFNRDLSPLEEKIAGSTLYRLTVDMFARWKFQFPRALMENLGAHPTALKRIVSDVKAGRGLDASEHLGGYLAKTLTGLGGAWFLYKTLEDRFDAYSAMYEKEDGNGIRMSGMSPIPEAMFVGYLLKGSWYSTIKGKEEAKPLFAKALAILPYTSFPAATFLTGKGGGLLSGLIAGVADAYRNKEVNPRAVEKVLVDEINRSIPGGSVLSALKSLSDPITREGVGANIPGVSLNLPAAPNSATGEPLELRQSIFGHEMPQIRSSAIPGATILRDPVTKILMKYGQKVYRVNRSPIAGVPANDLSPELQREWEFELGKQRQHTFHEFIAHPDMLDNLLPEQARALVMKQDALAARDATRIIQINHGIVPKPFRQPTARELTGPPELMKRYNLAKQAREQALAEEQ